MDIPREVDNVRLTLYLTNGKQHDFVGPNPTMALQTLQQLRPDRLFTPKQIILSGLSTVTVVDTHTIERLDIRSASSPDWPFHGDVADMAEISAEEFNARRNSRANDGVPVMGRTMPPRPRRVAIQAEMRSGREIFFEMEMARPADDEPMVTRTPDDIRLRLQHLFTWPAILGRLPNGTGMFLLNPANAVRFTLTPPPPEPITAAWPLDIVAPAT